MCERQLTLLNKHVLNKETIAWYPIGQLVNQRHQTSQNTFYPLYVHQHNSIYAYFINVHNDKKTTIEYQKNMQEPKYSRFYPAT